VTLARVDVDIGIIVFDVAVDDVFTMGFSVLLVVRTDEPPRNKW
jgi:hypothetical protein